MAASNLVPYIDFLERFQNRSDQGLAYRIISNGYVDCEIDSSEWIILIQ